MILNKELVMYGYGYPPEDDPEDAITKLTYVKEHTFRMADEDGYGELVTFEFDKNNILIRVKTGENYIYPKK